MASRRAPTSMMASAATLGTCAGEKGGGVEAPAEVCRGGGGGTGWRQLEATWACCGRALRVPRAREGALQCCVQKAARRQRRDGGAVDQVAVVVGELRVLPQHQGVLAKSEVAAKRRLADLRRRLRIAREGIPEP
eukprot:scaffold11431_cov118-Isochrysis_galbana.AAC.5